MKRRTKEVLKKVEAAILTGVMLFGSYSVNMAQMERVAILHSCLEEEEKNDEKSKKGIYPNKQKAKSVHTKRKGKKNNYFMKM